MCCKQVSANVVFSLFFIFFTQANELNTSQSNPNQIALKSPEQLNSNINIYQY
jgi:hypothetical protein